MNIPFRSILGRKQETYQLQINAAGDGVRAVPIGYFDLLPICQYDEIAVEDVRVRLLAYTLSKDMLTERYNEVAGLRIMRGDDDEWFLDLTYDNLEEKFAVVFRKGFNQEVLKKIESVSDDSLIEMLINEIPFEKLQ